MFSIEGMSYGDKHKVTYTFSNGKGHLEGDEFILFVINDAMNSVELTGPVGQYLERDINDPLAVLSVISECFDEITGYEGNLPEPAPMPDGTR